MSGEKNRDIYEQRTAWTLSLENFVIELIEATKLRTSMDIKKQTVWVLVNRKVIQLHSGNQTPYTCDNLVSILYPFGDNCENSI